MEKAKPLFFYCLTIIFYLLILLPILWFGFGTDQGLHAYGAWAWREFQLPPYVGCFDHNFPGIFIIHYLTQMIFGESVLGFRVFDLAWQAATAFLVCLVSCSVFKNRLAGFLAAAFYSVVYVNMGAWDTGQRDGFLLLPYLLGFWLLTGPKPEGSGAAGPFFSGILIGLAFLLKPVAALPGLVFAGLILKRYKPRLIPAAAFISGCALPFLMIIFYYWRIGSLDQLFQAIYRFNSEIYSGALQTPPLLIAGGIFLMRFWINFAQILLGIFLLALLLARKRKAIEFDRSRGLWLLLVFAGVYVGYLAQGKYYAYQQVPVWGLLCLFSGAGWGIFFEAMFAQGKRAKKLATAAFCLILLVLSYMLLDPGTLRFLAAIPGLSISRGQDFQPYFFSCRLAASYLQNHSGPEDKVQVWGSEALINYLAQRRAPSSFPSALSLIFRPGPNLRSQLQKQFGAELLASVKSDPPLYFLVETISHRGYGIASDKQVLIEDYPEIWSFISEKYSLDYNIIFLDGYIEFYKLRSSPQAPPDAQDD